MQGRESRPKGRTRGWRLALHKGTVGASLSSALLAATGREHGAMSVRCQQSPVLAGSATLAALGALVLKPTAACQASLSFTISQSLLKLMSLKSVMSSNHLILCHPLHLLPSFFPRIRVFSNESALCIRWLEYWNFSFSISPCNDYSGLISFRIDWFDHLAVQGALKSLL